jgi:uncharacterized membrane protein
MALIVLALMVAGCIAISWTLARRAWAGKIRPERMMEAVYWGGFFDGVAVLLSIDFVILLVS